LPEQKLTPLGQGITPKLQQR